MKLGKLNVTTGAQKAPLRELVYGTEGVGKTSFAADAPAPIFIGEDGTKRLEVARVDPPQTWDEFMGAIAALRTDKSHPFKTVVLDTLDHLEGLGFKAVAKRERRESIEDIGFGKGYTKVRDLCWKPLLAELERLQRERGMNVLLLAHAQVATFKNPAGDDYDRYTLKIHKEAAQLVKGWAESVLFASFDVATDKKKPRSEARWLYTERAPAYDAKNRYGLPSRIELSFPEFLRLMDRPADEKLREMRRSAERLLAQIASDEVRKKAEEVLAGTKTLAEMQRVLGRIHQRIAEQDEAAAATEETEATTDAPPSASGSPAADAPGGDTPKQSAPAANKTPAPTPRASDPAGAASPPAAPAEKEASSRPAVDWTTFRRPELLARLGDGARWMDVADALLAAFADPEADAGERLENEVLEAVKTRADRPLTVYQVRGLWQSVGGEIDIEGDGQTGPRLGRPHRLEGDCGLTGRQLGQFLALVPPVAPARAGAAS